MPPVGRAPLPVSLISNQCSSENPRGLELEGQKSSWYGPTWRRLNRFVHAHRNLFRCEHCGKSPVVLHHIAPGFERHWNPEAADHPHFMMLLCSSCHWSVSRSPKQSFQEERLTEWRSIVRTAQQKRAPKIFRMTLNTVIAALEALEMLRGNCRWVEVWEALARVRRAAEKAESLVHATLCSFHPEHHVILGRRREGFSPPPAERIDPPRVPPPLPPKPSTGRKEDL